MSEGKSSNKKLIWYVLFAIVTVVCCYLFVVIYFFYISPYNISLRLTFWPFSTEQQIGEMYSEALVKVSYTYKADEFDDEGEEISTIGVTISKDGFILFPYSEIDKCSDLSKIMVMTSSGTVYKGKFLYGNRDYNLALIKCENAKNPNATIKMPFVKVYDSSDYSDISNVIVSTPKLVSSSVWTGGVEDTDYIQMFTKEVNGKEVGSYTVEGGFLIKLSGTYSFQGGAVFDSKAHLLGFSYGDTLSLGTDQVFVLPAYAVNYFYNDVAKAYKKGNDFENDLIESLVGFDKYEADQMQRLSEAAGSEYDDMIFFGDDWQPVSSDFDLFITSDVNGYYLFQDFIYDSIVIERDSIITSVNVNGQTEDIKYKVDLFSMLWGAKSGDKIRITYQKYESTGYRTDSLTFTV
ncbi:MAG: hypothetical protein IJ817_00620 [Clostridia bacterium]|nr:hypothetical protein [Clostridia bacterium]